MSGTHRGLAGHVRRVTVEDWAFQQIGKKNRPASIFLLRSGGGGDTLLAMSDTKINNGGTAFPAVVRRQCQHTGITVEEHTTGMSLRDWFAGMALSAVIKSSGNLKCYYGWKAGSKGDNLIPYPSEVAPYCYELADGMIEARNAK